MIPDEKIAVDTFSGSRIQLQGMRFRINLEPEPGSGLLLPINYQYELSSWIYRTLEKGDADYSSWLHNQGFGSGDKRFKLFTLSGLHFGRYKVLGDRIRVEESPVSFVLSLYATSTAGPFIAGLFREQLLRLGDHRSEVRFVVTRLEKLPGMACGSSMQFTMETPCVISRREGKEVKYLSPEDTGYADQFIGNLLSKYKALVEEKQIVPGEESRNWDGEMKFEPLGKSRSKLITIKAGTPQQTQVKGFLFPFRLTVPPDLLRIGYYAGFGEKNSVGFGYGEIT